MNQPKKQHELFEIAGDAPDPVGLSRGRGAVASTNLHKSAISKPVVLYRDRLLTVDVYRGPVGEPDYLLLFCPLCIDRYTRWGRKEVPSLRIRADNKAWQCEIKELPTRVLKELHMKPEELVTYLKLQTIDDIRGKLSCQEFRCTWEPEPGLKKQYGFGQCSWHVAIDENIVRDV